MPHRSLICKKLVPLESLALGRLVLDKNAFDEYFLDLSVSREGNVVKTRYSRKEGDEESATGKSRIDALIKAFSSNLSREGISAEITADAATLYQIDELDSWLKEACKEETAQRWIEDMTFEGETIYIVVGYYVLSNVRFRDSTAPDSGFVALEGKLESKDVQLQNEFVNTLSVGGEYICAIQYARIELQWHSSSKLDSDTIAQKRLWKSHQGKRDSNKGVNDLLDAVIREDLELDEDVERYLLEK